MVNFAYQVFTLQLGLLYRLARWVRISADNILKYFSYFSIEIGFDILCTLSPKETILLEMPKVICWSVQEIYHQFVLLLLF